jgi:hypothetical protein
MLNVYPKKVSAEQVRWNHRKTSEYARARVIIFSLVQFLSKIIIKLIFFLKKSKPVQTDRFWFGYFRAKAETQPIGSIFSIWLGFFRFGSVINFNSI